MATDKTRNTISQLWQKPFAALVNKVSRKFRACYFKAQESIGQPKRDIIVHRVEEARNSLEDAKQQFQCALGQFSTITHFDGGDLEDMYRQLRGALAQSQARADAVSNRIRAIETVGDALFDEWQNELDYYRNRSLRSHSRQKLKTTRQYYDRLIKAMLRAESKIQPVLSAFQDQVLFLKHNLNAEAISSLQSELVTVGMNIAALITAMENSISEANVFMNTLVNQKALPAG